MLSERRLAQRERARALRLATSTIHIWARERAAILRRARGEEKRSHFWDWKTGLVLGAKLALRLVHLPASSCSMHRMTQGSLRAER